MCFRNIMKINERNKRDNSQSYEIKGLIDQIFTDQYIIFYFLEFP